MRLERLDKRPTMTSLEFWQMIFAAIVIVVLGNLIIGNAEEK